MWDDQPYDARLSERPRSIMSTGLLVWLGLLTVLAAL
jgi:hypothetical protein